jgi:anaerobic selenocysteine-containing dehydrogenase
LFIHPDEASARSLAPGAPVVLQNECGRLPLTLAVSETVPPGVALVHKGRWPKLDPSGANVNVLNAGRRTDLADSSAVHAVEAELIPAASSAVERPVVGTLDIA